MEPGITHQLRPREAQRVARQELVRDARAIMNARMSDPTFTVVSAAQELFVSRRHLQRSFQQDGSPGFRAELQEMRCQAAAKMWFDNPSLSVAHVCAAVGYRQPQHFAKAFRTHRGMPPSQFRSRCRDFVARKRNSAAAAA